MTAGRRVVGRFLQAVQDRDLDRIAACFTADATYANVPHEPAVGPSGVRALFEPIVSRSERIEWHVVSASFGDRTAWVERVDRFWVDGREYAIECNGVFVLDPTGHLLAEVRDYVDLDLWRRRLGDVLDGPS